MTVKKLAAGLLAFSFWLGCRAEPLDVSGHWGGTAELTVDGEPKVVDLEWELDHSESEIRGTIAWDDLRREVTTAHRTAGDSSRERDPERHDRVRRPFPERGSRTPIRYSVDPNLFGKVPRSASTLDMVPKLLWAAALEPWWIEDSGSQRSWTYSVQTPTEPAIPGGEEIPQAFSPSTSPRRRSAHLALRSPDFAIAEPRPDVSAIIARFGEPTRSSRKT
jgi:hypothetical protein